ncbi:LYR motif-containing protein 2 [Apodemus speciosus]|uniref:LYR motif-containing protein 2 n=1 Tax=Apodemus speciosus TaxID=105296 RepID=A0ABQ0EMQ6_APOSI
MAASRLPPAALTLKQFMRRQQVLLLYRKILRAIRQVPSDSDRKYLQDWAREEFKRNKSATEERYNPNDDYPRQYAAKGTGKDPCFSQILKICRPPCVSPRLPLQPPSQSTQKDDNHANQECK